MADNTDKQIITFANERVRPLADAIEQLYLKATAFQAAYAAGGLATLITSAGAANTIADGSDSDGRKRITGTHIINFKACVDQLVTALGTTAVTGVGSTVKAVADQIEVNGLPK